MKDIQLTQGKVAIVDDEDFEELSKYKWHYMSRGKHSNSPGYAARKKGKILYMHRIIMGVEDTQIIDHRSGDTLDNRKENLRLCTHAENMKNHKKRSQSLSMYKGLSKGENQEKWQVQLRVNGKKVHIGMFDSEIEAAKAYDKAARIHHGEFASTNFED